MSKSPETDAVSTVSSFLSNNLITSSVTPYSLLDLSFHSFIALVPFIYFPSSCTTPSSMKQAIYALSLLCSLHALIKVSIIFGSFDSCYHLLIML